MQSPKFGRMLTVPTRQSDVAELTLTGVPKLPPLAPNDDEQVDIRVVPFLAAGDGAVDTDGYEVPAFPSLEVHCDRLRQFQATSGPHSSSHAISMDEPFPGRFADSLRTDPHGSGGFRFQG